MLGLIYQSNLQGTATVAISWVESNDVLSAIGVAADRIVSISWTEDTDTCASGVTSFAMEWTRGAHGAGGASNGQPIELHDWRSINDLFKVDKIPAAQRATILAEDEAIISALMTMVTEDMI